jgi:hypothetical protein
MFRETDFDRRKFGKAQVKDDVGIMSKNIEWGES